MFLESFYVCSQSANIKRSAQNIKSGCCRFTNKTLTLGKNSTINAVNWTMALHWVCFDCPKCLLCLHSISFSALWFPCFSVWCFVRHSVKVKVKVACLLSRHPWLFVFNRLNLSPGKAGANTACKYWSNLGSVNQVPIIPGWTKAARNTKIALHMTSTWNWTPRPSELKSNKISTWFEHILFHHIPKMDWERQKRDNALSIYLSLSTWSRVSTSVTIDLSRRYHIPW